MDRGRTASVSLDVDNLWSYMKTHGNSAWRNRPSYYDIFVPHIIGVLDELGIKITFFIVGVDAADEVNKEPLKALADAGHELGNHSYEHEPWLRQYTRRQLEREIDQTDDAIAAITGQRPTGFRGPGYSWSEELLSVLIDRGYKFDASTLPTYVGPIARAYYFWTSKLSVEERAQRKELFGNWADGLRPVKPYLWSLTCEREILEIPVTTIPGIKLPFHFSYLLYLSHFSERLMMAYLWTALRACIATRTEPSFLLHPLDVIGADQVSELSFFPGMDMCSGKKTELLVRVIGTIAKCFEIVPMGMHADRILSNSGSLKKRKPD